MCPREFEQLIQCAGDQPASNFAKCRQDAVALHTCISHVSHRVVTVINSYYNTNNSGTSNGSGGISNGSGGGGGGGVK